MHDFTEQRLKQRRKVLKAGKLLVQPPSGTVDVAIRDLSESGAKLEIVCTIDLPKHLHLISVSNGSITPCEIVWQNGRTVGIRFTGPSKSIGIRSF